MTITQRICAVRSPIDESIRAMIANRRPGHSLEAAFYLSPAVYEMDMEAIFGRHWIFVAVEPDIPEPGDYVTVEIGKQSVVLVRDDDGQVRAYHNVCRHRGARLCVTPQGSVGNLVCSYHQWTYTLNGKLAYAEHMGEGFDKSLYSLKPVRVETLSGLIFVCLAADAPEDFAAMREQVEPYLRPHQLQDCKVAAQIDIIEEGNWKLTMENNRECYHCAVNHPELTASLFEFGYGYEPSPSNVDQLQRFEQMSAARCEEWEAAGLPSAECETLDSRITGYRVRRMPLDQAGESQTMDGRAASNKLLGALTRRDLGGLSLWTQPNAWFHFMSDHVVAFSALPLGPEKTLVRTRWLVRKDAVENVDYDVQNLTAVWRATNAQDRALVEMSQQGVRSPAYQPGPYSPFTESLVDKFCNWYVGRLAACYLD
ncbi:aromatic ring-hydroxylating oxygenase subunit alpha [Achromobacter piechaudii]|uniref:Carnitine monooxygenase oxygenase subunit n=1 Tax=Achromobacter piechaudii TaxID=72556 RepID=A0A6S7E9V6_9BURK|nr:aromatic ring-hydroxylating dioxygenase subunit alpha [Achromobacter piechaudii]CAB3902339.1 Carnitine monooxygenase oxygenase subunit [Achromobacter piechaudii]